MSKARNLTHATKIFLPFCLYLTAIKTGGFLGKRIAFIGSGFGGLCAACRLTTHGHQLENLYLVGAGTHPSAGLPGVLSSSIVVENLIQNET
jgi:phytoene dehydrogenase-like protein